MKGRKDMTKRRFIGIIMMIGAIGIGIYEGIWDLFIKSAIDLIQTYDSWKFQTVTFDVLKILIFFPMLMLSAYVLFKIGQMLFLDE